MWMSGKAKGRVEGERGLDALRRRLRLLYHGESRAALRFQLTVVIVDLAIIAFFVASPVLIESEAYLWLDYSIAALLAADMTGRALAADSLSEWSRRVYVWVDALVLVTLLLPNSLANLGFLRILRLWSLSRSGVLWKPLLRHGYGEWRDPVHAAMNLVTFLFVSTGFVYTWFFRGQGGLDAYIDALYYTVAAMTTTGFGDIVLPGGWGKLTAIVIMIIGISLFVRLGQAIFRPAKVFFPCPECALQRHDTDAVFCKACGHKLKIPDEGD